MTLVDLSTQNVLQVCDSSTPATALQWDTISGQEASPGPVPWVRLLLSSFQPLAGLNTHSNMTWLNTVKILTQLQRQCLYWHLLPTKKNTTKHFFLFDWFELKSIYKKIHALTLWFHKRILIHIISVLVLARIELIFFIISCISLWVFFFTIKPLFTMYGSFSYCWTGLICEKGLFCSSHPPAMGYPRYWEGAHLGQLTLTDQMAIPNLMASWPAIKTAGNEERRQHSELWHLSSHNFILMEPCFSGDSWLSACQWEVAL